MKVRVAIIGSGAVGSIHAAQLASQPDVELTAVFSHDAARARSFAGQYGVRSVGASIEEAVAAVDVAIVCSPSPMHFEQAQICLHAGRHTLIELPPCANVLGAEELGALAREKHVIVGCAHTSRYLAPYVRINEALRGGVLDEVLEISFFRYPQLRARSWTDDALLHHAAHVIDLAMHWCGGLEPLSCAAYPDASSTQSVSLVATLPGGKALTAAISYGGKLPVSRMVVVTAKHTVDTDGFSYLKSDLEQLNFTGDERSVYEQAIAAQDAHFLEACRGGSTYIPWTETEALLRVIEQFQALNTTNHHISRLDRS